MRIAHGITTLTAAGILTLGGTASAVQTPAEHTRRPSLEVAQGAPVRLAGELLWHGVPGQHRRAWARLVAELGPQTWAVWDRDTAVPRRIWGAGISAPGSMRSAEAAERAARAVLARHVGLLAPGARATDFALASNVESGGMRTVGFVQRAGGVAVKGGQVSFRFKNDRLIMIGSEALPQVPAPKARAVNDEAAKAAALAWLGRDLSPRTALVKKVGQVTVLPLIRAGKVDYATTVPVEVETSAPRGRWQVYVDAATGEPVAREQTLLFATGHVAYNAPLREPGGERQDYPANQAALTVAGADVTSSPAGEVTWDGDAATVVTTRASGVQVEVNNYAGDLAQADLDLAPDQTAVWSGADDEFLDAQISTFVHVNVVADYVRKIDPNFTFGQQQTVSWVNVDDSCNAFYDGVLVFFAESEQCQNTGRLADVIYHEFGHGVHFTGILPGVGALDYPLSEGASDYLATTINDDPAMGIGFFVADPWPLRHIDPQGFEMVWPDDIDVDPHFTGLILAGALWDLRKALVEEQGPDAVAVADRLYYESIRRAADIPSMYFEVLAADDDDGDLANGTPNLCLINEAFARHGLFKLGTELQAPAVAPPNVSGYTVSVGLKAASGLCGAPMLKSAELIWRLREQPDVGGVVAMDVSPDALTGQLPPQPAGSVIQYQVKMTFENSTVSQLPENVADPFYEMFVGAVEEIYCTDFETDPAADGWTHGLSAGEPGDGPDDWMWQEPLAPTGSSDPQAAYDGTRVFGTDLGGGDDDGLYQTDRTSFAQSPVIDTTGYSQVRLQYRRWLNVEDGHFDQATIYANDTMVWHNLVTENKPEATVHHTDREWRFHDVDLTPAITDNSVTVKYELTTDSYTEFGGWTLDAWCVVGVVDAPAATCGDGVVDAGEACDDGANNSDSEPDACRTDCSQATCGDGVVDSGEECDDGNNAGGDGCEPDCTATESPTTSDTDGELPQPPTTTDPQDPTEGPQPSTDGDPNPDSDSSSDTDSEGTDSATGGANDGSGCGCRSDDNAGGAGLSALGLLLLTLGRRRNRRGA